MEVCDVTFDGDGWVSGMAGVMSLMGGHVSTGEFGVSEREMG